MVIDRIHDSIGRKVDLGLVGQDGVAHPSLEVSNACGSCKYLKRLAFISKTAFLKMLGFQVQHQIPPWGHVYRYISGLTNASVS